MNATAIAYLRLFLLISPGLLAEVLSGNTYITKLFNPVDLFFLVLAYGKDFYKDYLQKQKVAELKGHKLEVIGWPNVTTALWERPDPTKKINVEKLVAAYHVFHNVIDLYYTKAGSC